MTDQLDDVSGEERDAVRALELFLEMLGRAKGDTYYWKWATISLHNACHGFMVLALRGTTSSVNLLSDEIRGKVVEEQIIAGFDDRVVTSHILGFMKLFERVQSADDIPSTMIAEAFVSTDAINSSMQTLNDLRNDFLHFRAARRKLRVSLLVPISLDVLEVIDFLLNQSGTICWISDEPYQERAREALRMARARLNGLGDYYRTIEETESQPRNSSYHTEEARGDTD